MNIGEKQEQLINHGKVFLNNLSSSNIKPSLSSFCYLTSFAETPGYAKLKYWLNGWSFTFNFCKILLKNILAIASKAEYIECCNSDSSQNYDTIILSWCYKKNFQFDGSYTDRYFKEKSKDLPNVYWILISMDGFVPENLGNNIKIIKNKKGLFKYNFYSFIKILFSIFFEYRFSPRKIFHYLYFSSYFAKIISKIIKKELKKNNYKVVLLPYEGQNFQNNTFFEIKKYSQKIKTIGYLHSITSLTSELIYRPGAPDLLLVHGDSQIEILKSKLNWPENRLILTQSFRYRQDSENYSLNKIFLPLTILKSGTWISEFEKLIKNSPPNNFPIFKIQNHPLAFNSKKHLNFMNNLEKILKVYKNRFSNNSLNKKMSIFFGVTEALEALENGVNIIHICSDPVLESYSEKLWHNIKVKQLSALTFQYNIINRGKYIIFGKQKNLLNKTLLNLHQ